MASSFYENLMRDPASLFAQMNLPQPASFPTFEGIAREAHYRSNRIFSNWTTLNTILERHEELLRKRWMKRKTREQRKKLLLEAWPDMPTVRDLQVFLSGSETPDQRQSGTEHKDSYFWPEINQEDLVQNRQLLLLFLNSRGRHLPEPFAHADLNAFRVGRVSGAIRPDFLNGSTMLLTGQRTAETYGRLIAWEDHDEAFNWMHSGFQFHPGDGLLVLRRQTEILNFLVKCCRLLTQDIPANLLEDVSTPVQPEPEPILPRPANEGAYQSIAAVAAEAPYRVPAHLDLQRLQSLISARRSAAEDHVWALREDPGYFAEVVKDVREHRQETLLDTRGKPHPVLTQDLFWDRVLGNVVINAYGSLIVWDKLREKVGLLASLHQQYVGEIKPTEDLPQELEKGFLTLRHYVVQASKGPIELLKIAVPPSPPMRSLWLREPQVSNSTIIRVGAKRSFSKDLLLKLFQLLWDKDQAFLHGLPNIVDLMQRLVREDPSRFSSHVTEIFSDLALLAETLHQLDLYQPWASTFEEKAVEHGEEIEKEFAESMSIFADLMNDFKDVRSLAALGYPSRDKFYYPVEKRRTEQTTEALRKAEQNLDIFWQAVDQHFSDKNKRSQHDRLQQLLSQNRQVQRTPAYSAPFKERKVANVGPETIYAPFSHLELRSEKQEQAKDHAGQTAIKQKVKTRGAPQPEEGENSKPMEIPLRVLPDQQPTFRVSKLVYKVFSTIFFVPSTADQQGEIAWKDFLQAMGATGFLPEKLYGSVWQFTPTKLDVERSINFHEPHPSGKIPYHIARRHGRRLNRAYGWTGDMFVLAE